MKDKSICILKNNCFGNVNKYLFQINSKLVEHYWLLIKIINKKSIFNKFFIEFKLMFMTSCSMNADLCLTRKSFELYVFYYIGTF